MHLTLDIAERNEQQYAVIWVKWFEKDQKNLRGNHEICLAIEEAETWIDISHPKIGTKWQCHCSSSQLQIAQALASAQNKKITSHILMGRSENTDGTNTLPWNPNSKWSRFLGNIIRITLAR